jgi:hypothetical protein
MRYFYTIFIYGANPRRSFGKINEWLFLRVFLVLNGHYANRMFKTNHLYKKVVTD